MLNKLNSARNVCLVCEKMPQVRDILPALSRAFPDISFSAYNGVGYFLQGPLPRHLPISKVPFHEKWGLDMLDHTAAWKINEGRKGQEDDLRNADLIISFCELVPKGAIVLAAVMKGVFGIDLSVENKENLYVYTGIGRPAEVIIGDLLRGEKFVHCSNANFKNTLSAGFFNREFSRNWALNSVPVFGQVLRRVGVNEGFISKFGLRTLFMLNETGPRKMGDALCAMQSEKVGTPVSRVKIVDDLLSMSLLSEADGVVSVSDKGKEFLSFVHKRNNDPHFGRRFNQWSLRLQAGDAAVWGESGSYLKAFFLRQKKLNLKL